jgi:hypothetical protein
MKARKPDHAEVYKHRKAVRPIFSGRSNPIHGISDAVLLSNTVSAKAARQAEREWKRTLSRGQRRKLRSA